ncbi:hypothetical protein [Leptospira santarosai]|uniref:hypothetical protein n=1 Tax=Leptospira santarosai TaxID=28183 RepID=UPI00036E6EF5|nr:hypothetical protein [Leptospira santarosai]
MRILEPEKRYSLNVKFEGENYSFLAEIADPSTELDIEIAVAKRLNGASLESIPNSVYGYLIAIETLNHVIKEIPVNLQIRFNSFEKIRDKEFVVRLFNEYKKKENWFLAELKKNRDTRRGDFRREKHSRFHPDKRVSDTSTRSNESRKSFSRAETISDRSDVEDRHRNVSETHTPPFGKETSRENGPERIPGTYQPANGEYSRGRGRVLERTDSGARRI